MWRVLVRMVCVHVALQLDSHGVKTVGIVPGCKQQQQTTLPGVNNNSKQQQ